MDTTPLVDDGVSAGLRYLDALDKAGVPVLAAFWLRLREAQEWRFVVATPLVQRNGPLFAYKRLQSLLASFGDDPRVCRLILSELTVVSPSDERVRLLARSLDYGEKTVAACFDRVVIGGVAIDDTIVNRMNSGTILKGSHSRDTKSSAAFKASTNRSILRSSRGRVKASVEKDPRRPV